MANSNKENTALSDLVSGLSADTETQSQAQ